MFDVEKDERGSGDVADPPRAQVGKDCGAPEAYAVPWRYTYPRPRIMRLYPREAHGGDDPAAEPLTSLDRARIAGRRAARRAELERAGITVPPVSRRTRPRTGRSE
ncbi:hypothetical protein Ae406Ps2_6320 [Pseudonocardia sp. Ae406_Ps2]|nr:hypothetical protein Ae406Ps2_6320 [Pseudonocardia sp. Ae406_Ps2]